MPSQTIRSYHPAAALRLAHWLLLVGFILSYCGLLPATPVPVAEAQMASFPITESFQNSTALDWIFKRQYLATNIKTVSELLTSDPLAGVGDKPGEGWLRLTDTKTATPYSKTQKGYAIYNKAYPATDGIVVKFKYAAWGGTGTNNPSIGDIGGDGFTFFLLDGSVENPGIGSPGGALGYHSDPSKVSPNLVPGVTKAYVGIGFDEIGNFSLNKANDSITPDAPGTAKANSVVIRGAGNGSCMASTACPSEPYYYRYLKGVWLNTISGSSTVQTNFAKWSGTPSTCTSTVSPPNYCDDDSGRELARATARDVEISIINEKITVKIDFKGTIGLKTIIDKFDLKTAPNQNVLGGLPSTFKMGFSAATQGATNIHEIRGVTVYKPANLSIKKTSDKMEVSPGEALKYTIEINNDDTNAIDGLVINDPVPASLTNVTWTCSATDDPAYPGTSCGTSNGTGNTVSLNAKVAKKGKITIVVDGTVSSAPTVSMDNTASFVLPTGYVNLDNAMSASVSPAPTIKATPPKIIEQPKDQLINSGETATLNVVAMGYPAPTYQWYKVNPDGSRTPVSGATSATLSTTEAGKYQVDVTGSGTTIQSVVAEVKIHQFPTITTAPTDQTIPFGTKPTLTVAATGDVAPTYQWYKVVVENGVEKEVEVTGATSASFTPGDLTSDTTFRVKVTTTVNGVAKTVSSDSKITVTLPTITSDTTVKSGETAKLDVTLPTGANASDYTYQWYEVLPDGSEVLVTGATGASFTTPSLTSNKKYKAKVTGPTGTVEVGPTAVTVNQPPTVTTQTISNTLSDGKAPLSVAATPQVASDGPLTYQWYKLNADGITWDLVTGAAGASFEATAPGKYKAVVTTAKGVSKDSEVMTVNPGPPTITTQPTSTALGSNGPAPLSVGAALSPGSKDTLAYQWYKKDASGNWVKVDGATDSTFNATDPGEYKAIVTADGASVESQVATVSPAPTANPTSTPTPSPTETSVPNNPLPPTIIDPPTDTQLGSKGQATLSVTAQLPSGSKGPLSYQWLTQDAQGSWITITGATAPTFSTQMPGVYKVVVTSADGAKVESKPATVNTPPVIATPPQPQTVSAGHPVTLTVVVTSTIPVTYTWYQINPDKTIKVVGTNSPTLTVQVTQTTSFSVSVRNNLGTVSTPPVTVMVKPVVADQVIPSGNTTTLGVPAQPDTSYQWYIVDPLTNQLTPIGGATSSTYNTPPLTQTTTFALKITPPTGEPVTIKLTVTVQPPPTTATATPVYPIARDDLAFAVPSVPRGIAVLGNDYDPNHSPLQIVGVGKPAHGVALLKGEFIFYTADSAFLGTDVFTYTISNGSLTATAKVTLTVTQENKNLTPLAYNYLFTTTQNIPITVTEVQVDSANILRNPDRDTQAVLTLWKPLHGKVWAEGQLIHYLPDLDFVGTDTFTYTLTDGDLRSLPGRITIVVLSPINIGGDAKVWKDDPFTRTAVISPSAGVPPWTGEVNYGDGTLTQTLKVNPDGTFRLTHTYTKSGVFTVTVALKDGTGKVTVKKFQVTVEPKPVIVAEKHFYYFPLMLGKDSKSSTSVQYRLYFPLLLKDVGPSKHQIHLALIIKQATPKTK